MPGAQEYLFKSTPDVFCGQGLALIDTGEFNLLISEMTTRNYARIDVRSKDWTSITSLDDVRSGASATIAASIQPDGETSLLRVIEVSGEWAKVEPEVIHFLQHLAQKGWIDTLPF